MKRGDDDKLGRDDRVQMPLDPEVALRALIEVGEPDPDPRREAERKRQAEKDARTNGNGKAN